MEDQSPIKYFNNPRICIESSLSALLFELLSDFMHAAIAEISDDEDGLVGCGIQGCQENS
jgi:hypothetical protein